MSQSLPVPLNVLKATEPGVYPGSSGDIESWATTYLDSGRHLMEWETRCAQYRADLAQWVRMNGNYDPEAL